MALPIHRHNDVDQWSNVRVTGVLTADAHLAPTTGRDPHTLLFLDFQPPHGLPYHATVDLGADAMDHMAAEADLPLMRRGALISVAGHALELRADHGHAVLRVVKACDVFIPLK